MKNLNKIINIVLILLSCLVAAIFIFGTLKKSNSTSEPIQKIDQSSVSFSKTSKETAVPTPQDELTNKYMKELQLKLKKEELEASNQIKKARNYQRSKTKNDDFTQVPVEQQISKDVQYESRETSSIEKSPSGISFGGVVITKETAADFIQTARKNGYHVVLSEAYEVISVTPILNAKGMDDSFQTVPEN